MDWSAEKCLSFIKLKVSHLSTIHGSTLAIFFMSFPQPSNRSPSCPSPAPLACPYSFVLLLLSAYSPLFSLWIELLIAKKPILKKKKKKSRERRGWAVASVRMEEVVRDWVCCWALKFVPGSLPPENWVHPLFIPCELWPNPVLLSRPYCVRPLICDWGYKMWFFSFHLVLVIRVTRLLREENPLVPAVREKVWKLSSFIQIPFIIIYFLLLKAHCCTKISDEINE